MNYPHLPRYFISILRFRILISLYNAAAVHADYRIRHFGDILVVRYHYDGKTGFLP